MNRIIFTALFVMISCCSYAQQNDTLFVHINPIPIRDTASVSDTLVRVTKDVQREFQVTISLAEVRSFARLDLKIGSMPGMGNIYSAEYTYLERNGKKYLSYDTDFFEIINNSVTVRFPVWDVLSKVRKYIGVSAVNENGIYTTIYSQELK